MLRPLHDADALRGCWRTSGSTRSAWAGDGERVNGKRSCWRLLWGLPSKGRRPTRRGGEKRPPRGGRVGRCPAYRRAVLVLGRRRLTILSQTPDLFAALHEGCVLTPHAGEFARLFPDIAGKLAAPATKGPACSKVDAAREAAKRAGCVVLYKGPDTVIRRPLGTRRHQRGHWDRAAPWLATAGSGDVLAGFITGLLARGFSPFDAACTGAWLHVECARSYGPGLIAERSARGTAPGVPGAWPVTGPKSLSKDFDKFLS